ncbi:hypothetical protein [Sphingobium cloacae]|nr:hypothetical protein [Sphingobium cloacae]
MGGIGSGALRSRHVGDVEDVLALDIRVLRRLGVVRPGECVIDTICWSTGGHERPQARLRIDLSDSARGMMAITAHMPDDAVTQRIAIEGIASGFGGIRYYFLCPVTGQRCEILYYTDGRFASRHAHRLTYASQNMTDLTRAHRRIIMLRRRLEGSKGRPRPKGRKRAGIIDRLNEARSEARNIWRDRLRKQMDRSDSRWIPGDRR